MRLYRGISTPLVTVAFYNAITFSVYEAALKRIRAAQQQNCSGGGGTGSPNGNTEASNIHQNALAGIISGLARVRYYANDFVIDRASKLHIHILLQLR